MKKVYIAAVMCTVVALSGSLAGCKKRYVSPLETPAMTKAPEDKAYEFDFDQLNNDVIEELQDKEIYSFVKAVDVSGDNEKKEIVLTIDIDKDVSDDAVELLLTDATKAVVDGAQTQDFRIDGWNEEGFGNLFELYGYTYKVTSGDEVVREETLNVGDSVPFDPTLTLEQVIG